jgi:hypothetical protein
MLFLFGRYGQPVKVLLGVALIVIGIVVHHVVYAIIGAVLLLWGGATLLASVRNRGQRQGTR